ncbi:MAG: phosphatase PAP2 family protein, partial [Fibrobacter sp.]|nr:phosphatase PAP2 family protein [Fibrobacter sp.]
VLTLEKDLPLTFFAAFGSIYGNYRLSHMAVTAREDLPAREDLLPWDRAVMGRYNKTVDDVSDWFAVLGAMPLALGAASWYRGDACGRDLAVYSLMFAQALALQSALNLTFRSMKFWPRPYIYAEDGAGARAAESAEGEAYGSFFSGHASAAFTVAVFTGEWFSEMYPNSAYRPLVWAGTLSLAGFVGVLRIAAGKHYPSDVVVGALAGTGISLAVIRLHKKSVRFGPVALSGLWAGPASAGATFAF